MPIRVYKERAYVRDTQMDGTRKNVHKLSKLNKDLGARDAQRGEETKTPHSMKSGAIDRFSEKSRFREFERSRFREFERSRFRDFDISKPIRESGRVII